ncbi:MAG TPA: hypothetical protein VFU49_21250 [Ktedonobacteraceae bacterium]|nr:hypothetical protein [Ktedonobacteraceae bacterium]
MKSEDVPAFQYAIRLARLGQTRNAYEQFCKLSRNPPNRNDPDLLLWIAETTPLYAEAQRALDEAESIAPHHPGLPQAEALFTRRFPSAAQLLSFQTGDYRCPFCGTLTHPIIVNRVSAAGWAVCVALIVCIVTIEFCWIGLFLRENIVTCPMCNHNLKGMM